MALQQSITKFGTEFPNAYHRISRYYIGGTNETTANAEIYVAQYVDATARAAEKAEVTEVSPSAFVMAYKSYNITIDTSAIVGTTLYESLYGELKKLPEFEGSVDC